MRYNYFGVTTNKLIVTKNILHIIWTYIANFCLYIIKANVTTLLQINKVVLL